jgi:hypothetical protein
VVKHIIKGMSQVCPTWTSVTAFTARWRAINGPKPSLAETCVENKASVMAAWQEITKPDPVVDIFQE